MTIRVAYPILLAAALGLTPAAAQTADPAPAAAAPAAPVKPKPEAKPKPKPEAKAKPKAEAKAKPKPEPVSPEAAAAARAVSAFRAANGLGPVVADPKLVRAAKAQADAMAQANTMSHSVGGSFPSRLSAAGIAASAAAENIAVGQADLAEAMRAWENSSGHRKNMLMSSATRIGLAKTYAGSRPYWAMILAAPDPPPREEAMVGPRNGYFGSGPSPFSGFTGFSIGPFTFGR
jgi:uncharacterized protein YkwD